MKKTAFTLFLLALLAESCSAVILRNKPYHMGAGLKIGMAPGLTLKYFYNPVVAFDGILTYRWSGMNLAGLAEFHVSVFDTKGMYFYYGGGLHAGYWDPELARDKPAGGRKLNFGIDAIAGLEYGFPRFPMSIGLDWKPNYNIVTDHRLIIDEISLVLRYLIR